MAILTSSDLANLRRQVGNGVVPITWSKSTINAATQGVDDVLEAQAFDANTLVSVVITTNAEAQQVTDDLESGTKIPISLVPIVQSWLKQNPISLTVRSLDKEGVVNYVVANKSLFATAVAGMPSSQQTKVVEAVVTLRVKGAV